MPILDLKVIEAKLYCIKIKVKIKYDIILKFSNFNKATKKFRFSLLANSIFS